MPSGSRFSKKTPSSSSPAPDVIREGCGRAGAWHRRRTGNASDRRRRDEADRRRRRRRQRTVIAGERPRRRPQRLRRPHRRSHQGHPRPLRSGGNRRGDTRCSRRGHRPAHCSVSTAPSEAVAGLFYALVMNSPVISSFLNGPVQNGTVPTDANPLQRPDPAPPAKASSPADDG